jgi:hypothetical protein
MTIKLRDTTPAGERLNPAATEAELLWFRKKRQAALVRTMFLTAGMSALYYLGSLLNDGRHADDAISLVYLGIIAVIEVGMVIHTLRSGDVVKEIRAKRIAMYDEQRKRIFLAALDDELSAD